jgi:phosphoribosyl 1,2-cyclic phosphate phosphodiesterase
VGARETYFVHMSHRAGMHAIMNVKFPPHMQFAYDGLCVEFF